VQGGGDDHRDVGRLHRRAGIERVVRQHAAVDHRAEGAARGDLRLQQLLPADLLQVGDVLLADIQRLQSFSASALASALVA
jgi:hypothetical protein